MITFLGLLLLLIAIFIQEVLVRIGLFRVGYSHPSDWLVLLPYVGAIGCFLYSLAVLMARYLP